MIQLYFLLRLYRRNSVLLRDKRNTFELINKVCYIRQSHLPYSFGSNVTYLFIISCPLSYLVLKLIAPLSCTHVHVPFHALAFGVQVVFPLQMSRILRLYVLICRIIPIFTKRTAFHNIAVKLDRYHHNIDHLLPTEQFSKTAFDLTTNTFDSI